jgi:hypothetical protein
VQPLNRCDAREYAGSGVAGGGQQQPRDGVGVGRFETRCYFTDDFASVVVFPGWPSVMFRDQFVLGVEELCVGGFENPGELLVGIGAGLADVDLIAGGVSLQDQFFRCGGGEFFGNVGARGLLLRLLRDSRSDREQGEKENKDEFAHGETSLASAAAAKINGGMKSKREPILSAPFCFGTLSGCAEA